MAQIPVERRGSRWPWWVWLLALLLCAGLIWLLITVRSQQRDRQQAVVQPSALAQVRPAPTEPSAGFGVPTTSIADATIVQNAGPSVAEPTSVAVQAWTRPTPTPAIASIFRRYYEQNGGLAIFGYPLGEPLIVNGRQAQWFERARLEYWPEYAGTPEVIQMGLLGREYLDEPVPPLPPLESTPDRRYFRETGHTLSGGFLHFWERNGGLSIFGYPISEERQELIDGQPYTVQYFERARLVYHPDLAGTPHVIQVGLLGRELFLKSKEARQ